MECSMCYLQIRYRRYNGVKRSITPFKSLPEALDHISRMKMVLTDYIAYWSIHLV